MVWVGVSVHVVCTAAPWGAGTLVIACSPLTARAALEVLGDYYAKRIVARTQTYVNARYTYQMAGGYGSYGDRRYLSLCLGGANEDLRADVPARPLAGRPRRALDDAGDPRAAARSQAVQAPPRRPPGDREQPALRATARTRGGRDHPQAHAPSPRRRRGLRAHRGGRATARSTDRPRVVGARSPCRRSHRPGDGSRGARRAVPFGNADETPGSESRRDVRVPRR